jgi:hypothetical protein
MEWLASINDECLLQLDDEVVKAQQAAYSIEGVDEEVSHISDV